MNGIERTATAAAVVLGAWLLAPAPAWAQGFSSGSDGSDGALNIAGGQGVVNFDPAALGLDADGDRVFQFTTIAIRRSRRPGRSAG